MIAAPTPPAIVVCDSCRVRSLSDALSAARAGITIIVHGEQRGQFVVKMPVTIAGAGDAVLDGQGRGTVLLVQAPDVTIRDLSVRGSGSDFVAMDAGIRSNAARTTIRNVGVADTLFGIYLAHSDDSTVDGARIVGRRSIPVPLRGDAVRVWYSKNVRIANNSIVDARDDLVWFSPGARFEHNHVRGGRYGFHSMYSNGMTIASNVVEDCEIGSYIMYGKNVRIEGNVFSNNRGSTGYGVGMKSIDDAIVDRNAFVSNHLGVYVDNSPSEEGSVDRFESNLFAYNEIGFAGLPSSRGDVLLANSFVENYRQIGVLGGGTLTALTWSEKGHGNYWSDYAGYDRNADGIGDVRYEDRSAYGTLADVDSRLGLLTYSPAAKALDFAAKALPIFAPPATVVDNAPLMASSYPQGLPPVGAPKSRLSYEAMGVLALGAAFGILVPFRPRLRKPIGTRRHVDGSKPRPVIEASGLFKEFGRNQALNGVDLEIVQGEALALWGPNGSGKTTLLRCLLGVVRYRGRVVVRADYGYVPQQLPIFDMRVGELAQLIAGLHGVPDAGCALALEDADLGDLGARNVAELSGGQRQRLAIALAGFGNPDVLMLDEPTVGLDLRSRNAILHSLKASKAAGKTIVIASHIPEDVTAIADRIAIMERGRITGIVTPPEFIQMIDRQREAS